MANANIFIGTIINPSRTRTEVNVIENGFIITVDTKIVKIGTVDKLEEAKSLPQLSKLSFSQRKLKPSQFIIPGLIDTHIHAPQYPNAGLGYDEPLLEWLNKYTYQLESKYKDLQFSDVVYNAVVKKTLSYGTTTACYFASMYHESSMVLVNAAIAQGQRAFVGKINMTRLAPECYIETPEDSIKNTIDFVKMVLDKKSDIVKPIITPRFALSLDMALMKELGRIAKDHDLNIQTHISENVDECNMVEDLFGRDSYAGVYDEAQLLTPKTVLAHGIYLSDAELQLLASKGASVSHCANSNTRLKSGLCNVRKLEKFGVNIGLGTDISGGASASIIDAMRCAIDTSIHLTHLTNSCTPITCYEAFYMATMGGAKALAIDDKVGILEEGKEFDALIVDMAIEDSSSDLLLDTYSSSELLQKFIFLGDDRNILKVYVAGKNVKGGC